MQRSPDFLYLSRDDVARLGLTAEACLPVIEAAFAGLADGTTVNGDKVGLFASATSFSYAMPGLLAHDGVAGVKWVSGADNGGTDLPNIAGMILLSDVATGAVLALLDGDLITAERTAAVSLAGAVRLARPDSRRLGLVACGVQAVAHFHALRSRFPIEDLRCFSRSRATADRMAGMARGLGLTATVVDSAAEAVAARDIVVTSVPRSAGLVQDLSPALLAPGCFVAAPDLARRWIGAEALGFDRILTEHLAQSRLLGKKGMIPWTERFDAALADLLAGHCTWRPDPVARTIFVHAGIGLTDVAVARLAVERARALGIGRMLPR